MNFNFYHALAFLELSIFLYSVIFFFLLFPVFDSQHVFGFAFFEKGSIELKNEDKW